MVVYESALATLHHGDCREILPSLGKWSADLVVTDPPYGIGYESNYRTGERMERMAHDDGRLDMPVIFEQIARVLRRWRHAYVFGPFVLPPPFTAHADLIWNKTEASGRGNMTIPWGQTHENVRVTARGKMRHPTEKPVALLRRYVEASSLLGDVVLDPFAGSGSTLVAAVAGGRRAVGIEISDTYCEVIIERLHAVERAIAVLEQAMA